MPGSSPVEIRNTCLVGHGSSGKTSLAEAILFSSGITTRLGKVDEGNTLIDYLPEEIKRKISISAKVISISNQDNISLNLIDTPGYSDFIGEVISVLNVVESVIFVVCGVGGVEVQTEIISDYVKKQNLPQVVFINKLDRENADFYRALTEVEGLFDKPVVPLYLPLGKEANLVGYYDLLKKEEILEEKGKNFEEIDENLISHYHMKLIETIVETDEELLTKYLEDSTLELPELTAALKKGVKGGRIIPVLCGSATSLIGVKPFADFIFSSLPAPNYPSNKELLALVYKTMADPYVGKLSFTRVFSGKLDSDSQILNISKNKSEKISQILKLQGKKQQTVKCLQTGDIGVIPKLSTTVTGDILGERCNQTLEIERLLYPEPYFEFAIEPKTKGDEEKLSGSLAKIAEEDLTLKVFKRVETKEMIIKGMGEIHLETAIERLLKKFGVEVVIKTPKIPYRETIKKSVKIEGKHKKQTGGHGQYGHVWLEIEPLDEEFRFVEKIFGGSVPKQYIPAVEKGIVEAMQEGVLGGFPVTNVKVTLYDGSYHNVDSSELAFKIAASHAFKKGCQQANPIVLEPVYNVVVTVPDQFMGDIISDLNTRRGKVVGMEPSERWQVVKAQVPLEELQNYSVDLKSLTQGRATYSIRFSHYAEVPNRKTEALTGNK